MTSAVWKYVLPIEDEATLALPAGCHVLKIAQQYPTDDFLTMWVLADSNAPDEPRHFRIAGTGHSIDENQSPLYNASGSWYVDSVVMFGGSLVFHVFEFRP